MPVRLDAHAHFFSPGYVDLLPEECRQRQPDEVTLYRAHAARHNIGQVLGIGYEGAPWAANNNSYLASIAKKEPWLRPLAYVAVPPALTVSDLEAWHQQGFVGISLYLMNPESAAGLGQVRDGVWGWLQDHRWLASVNSCGPLWPHWRNVMDRFPHLRLLISHLGLPPAQAIPPSHADAAAALASVLALAAYPGAHVKLSGLYALTAPSHAFPHTAAWPYIELLVQAFGVERLLWGSDFSPALEHVSFAQTLAFLDQLPWLTADARDSVAGSNLARLLRDLT